MGTNFSKTIFQYSIIFFLLCNFYAKIATQKSPITYRVCFQGNIEFLFKKKQNRNKLKLSKSNNVFFIGSNKFKS